MPAGNSTFEIGGVSSPLDSFVVTESFVLRINIDGKKPAAHSSTFDFLPTYKAQTKKPKELEFFSMHGRQK